MTPGEKFTPRLIVQVGHLVARTKTEGTEHRNGSGLTELEGCHFLDILSAFTQPWLFAHETEIVTYNVNDNDSNSITNSQHSHQLSTKVLWIVQTTTEMLASRL